MMDKENKEIFGDQDLDVAQNDAAEQISEVSDDIVDDSKNTNDDENIGIVNKNAIDSNGPKRKKPKKIKNTAVLKRGTYATVITVIFIIGAIVLNVLATALSERFPLQADLTADGINTISKKNVEYIKGVEKEVRIYVTATEAEYTGSYFSQYAYTNYSAQDDTGKYFSQTAVLIKEYGKHNPNIKIEFCDTSSPEFASIAARYSTDSIGYGDILVECTNSTEDTRTKKLAFQDIYELYDESGYAAMGYSKYQVTGSKLESVLTSAIYSVTSDKTTKIGIPINYCDETATAKLLDTLAANNYEIVKISDLVLNSIPADLDGIVLAAPKTDMSATEIEALDKFLDNGGKNGKALIYFASVYSPSLPRISEFLADWGIRYLDGVVYETSSGNHIPGDPMTIGLLNKYTTITASANSDRRSYISGNNIPMEQAFVSYDDRETVTIMTSSSYSVVKPSGSPASWSPASGAEKLARPVAIASVDTNYDSIQNEYKSTVVAFASVDFISSSMVEQANVGNLDFVLAAAGSATGRNADDITFITKSITNQSFADKVTEAGTNVIRVVFMFGIPITLAVVGIIVWVRRKNR